MDNQDPKDPETLKLARAWVRERLIESRMRELRAQVEFQIRDNYPDEALDEIVELCRLDDGALERAVITHRQRKELFGLLVQTISSEWYHELPWRDDDIEERVDRMVEQEFRAKADGASLDRLYTVFKEKEAEYHQLPYEEQLYEDALDEYLVNLAIRECGNEMPSPFRELLLDDPSSAVIDKLTSEEDD